MSEKKHCKFCNGPEIRLENDRVLNWDVVYYVCNSCNKINGHKLKYRLGKEKSALNPIKNQHNMWRYIKDPKKIDGEK